MSRDYVGVKPCGCYVTWISDGLSAKEKAKTIAEWIRDGLSVERMDTETARVTLKACPHQSQPKGTE